MPQYAGPLHQTAPTATAVHIVDVPDLASRDLSANYNAMRIGQLCWVAADGHYYQLVSKAPLTWLDKGDDLFLGNPAYFAVTDAAALAALTPRVGDVVRVLSGARTVQWDGAAWQVVHVEAAPPGTTLFVDSSTGDDDNDGLTPGVALETIQAAVDQFKDGFSGVNFIEVRVGSGAYAPVTRHPTPGPNGSLFIVGDRSSPLVSNATPSFVASGTHQSQLVDPAYGGAGAIADGTHWMEIDLTAFGSPFGIVGVPVVADTLPSLTVVSFNATFGPSAVYPITTQIDVSDSARMLADSNSANDGYSGVHYAGIEFVGTFAAASFEALGFMGCRWAAGGSFVFDACRISGYADPATVDVTIVGGTLTPGFSTPSQSIVSEFHGRILRVGVGVRINASTLIGSAVEFLEGAIVGLAQVDWEQSGVPCMIYRSGCVINFERFGFDFNVINTPTSFLEPFLTARNMDSIFEFAAGLTITGAVSGNAVRLVNGSRCAGIEAACSGSLTAGGSEIVVGANAGANFSTLPANDLGAGTPQGCFAT